MNKTGKALTVIDPHCAKSTLFKFPLYNAITLKQANDIIMVWILNILGLGVAG